MESKLKDLMGPLVQEVGRELLDIWPGRTTRKLSVSYKSNGSPVTEADILANRLLVAGIQEMFPNEYILSEEGVPFEQQVDSNKPVWIMDPLDGTRSFIRGRDDFSILIGRCENGKATFGMMYFPALGLFAYGEKGKGAFINLTPIKVTSCLKIEDARVFSRPQSLINSKSKLVGRLDTGRAMLGVARGEFDVGVIELDIFGAHDFAAPAIIIEEAGGKLSDEFGREDLFSLVTPPTPRFIIAGNTHLVSAIQSQVV